MKPHLHVCEKCVHFEIVGPDHIDGDGNLIHFSGATLLCLYDYQGINLGGYYHYNLEFPLNMDYFKPDQDIPNGCSYRLEHTVAHV